MEIDPVLDDIWKKLEYSIRLTREDEKALISHLEKNFTRESAEIAQKIVFILKARSISIHELSIEEMKSFYEEIKCFNIKAADEHLEAAIANEWKGAFINAQANRIENKCNKYMEEMRQTWSQYRQGKDLEEVLNYIYKVERENGLCNCNNIKR